MSGPEIRIWESAFRWNFKPSSRWDHKGSMLACLVASNSLRPFGLQPARLLWPWDFFRQELWSGLPFPSPGDLLARGSKPHLLCLLHCRQILYLLNHQGSLIKGAKVGKREKSPKDWERGPVTLWDFTVCGVQLGSRVVSLECISWQWRAYLYRIRCWDHSQGYNQDSNSIQSSKKNGLKW